MGGLCSSGLLQYFLHELCIESGEESGRVVVFRDCLAFLLGDIPGPGPSCVRQVRFLGYGRMI